MVVCTSLFCSLALSAPILCHPLNVSSLLKTSEISDEIDDWMKSLVPIGMELDE